MANSSKKIQLIDAFLFYNELDMLKARLEYLGPLVDYFVICEADTDFSGRKKGFMLSDEFVDTLPYAKKIIYHREYIKLNSIPWLIKRLRYHNRKKRLLWKIQDVQRNSILKPLKSFNSSDIIIFSDLDEFPNEKAIHEAILKLNSLDAITKSLCFSCDQLFFYYNIKNAATHGQFYGSIFANLETFNNLLPHKLRSQKDRIAHIQNGGWHFSYFMDEDKILNKVMAISDVENLSQYKKLTKEKIREKILAGTDLYDRKTKMSNQEQYNIPTAVLELLKKYLPYAT